MHPDRADKSTELCRKESNGIQTQYITERTFEGSGGDKELIRRILGDIGTVHNFSNSGIPFSYCLRIMT